MIFPKISSKQIDILILLYKFRFLSTSQIQIILNHKSTSRISFWLKDLQDKQYISLVELYSKLEKQTNPRVFTLNKKSIQILKQNNKCNILLLKLIYKSKYRSRKFIFNSLFLADIYIKLLAQIKDSNLQIFFFTKIDLFEYDYFPTPFPEAYITIKNASLVLQRYFIELIDETTPRFMIRKRIKKYFNYCLNNLWEDTTNTTLPYILFVCHNLTTKNYVYSYINKLIQLNDLTIFFYLTTKSEILHSDKKEIWQKVV